MSLIIPTFDNFFCNHAFRDFEWPTQSVYETKDSYTYRFDVPGVKKENVQIEISDENVLTVYCERSQNKAHHKYQRRVQLHVNADTNNVSATLENGELILKMGKLNTSKTKMIKIN